MNKKLIFRILGALASALIIVSVFVPFVSVTGYTTSLWESFELANSIYLPIMIIVFGAIGVVFFALNVKTEFAYMSTGAITFFLVIETIDILNQGVFNTLSIGYYFLAVGALLTGVMAFLTNLKAKNKVENVVPVTTTPEPTMLDQIDKLYNEQTSTQNEISPIQPVDNVIEPIPVQPVEMVSQVQPVEQEAPIIEEQPVPQATSFETVMPTPAVEPQQQVSPVQPEVVPVQESVAPSVEVQPIEQVTPIIEEQPVSETNSFETVTVVEPQQSINPVLQEFNQPTANPVVQEFSTPEFTPNSVVQEFSTPQVNQQSTNIPVMPEPVNPVVQEFANPGSSVAPQTSTNELDIFGQPINK